MPPPIPASEKKRPAGVDLCPPGISPIAEESVSATAINKVIATAPVFNSQSETHGQVAQNRLYAVQTSTLDQTMATTTTAAARRENAVSESQANVPGLTSVNNLTTNLIAVSMTEPTTAIAAKTAEPTAVNNSTTNVVDSLDAKQAPSGKPKQEDTEHMPLVFRRDIEWDDHHFDNADASYEQVCPNGGPGGLICCSTCASLYSDFLLKTQQNLEVQQTLRVKQEITTMSAFLSQTKMRLKASIAAARKRPPPASNLRKIKESSESVAPEMETANFKEGSETAEPPPANLRKTKEAEIMEPGRETANLIEEHKENMEQELETVILTEENKESVEPDMEPANFKDKSETAEPPAANLRKIKNSETKEPEPETANLVKEKSKSME